jgi:hypothetical protein
LGQSGPGWELSAKLGFDEGKIGLLAKSLGRRLPLFFFFPNLFFKVFKEENEFNYN